MDTSGKGFPHSLGQLDGQYVDPSLDVLASKAEVLRQALRLYEFVAKRIVERGDTIHTVDRKGESREIFLIGPGL